jgi:hypothetical protein
MTTTSPTSSIHTTGKKVPLRLRRRLARRRRTTVSNSFLHRLLTWEHELRGGQHRTDLQATPGEQFVRELAAEEASRTLAKGATVQDKYAEEVDDHRSQATAARRAHQANADKPTPDHYGGHVSIADAERIEQQLRSSIAEDTANGDQRHLRASRNMRWLVLAATALDFPVLLWFVSSVFNVPWQRNPLGFPLAVSIVFALFATLVAALVLHHTGTSLRPYKTPQRELPWHELPASARVRLILAGIVIATLSAVMYTRIHSETAAAGNGDATATLLSLLLAVLAAASNSLVSWVAFTDGSDQTDALEHYAPIIKQASTDRQKFAEAASALDEQVRLTQRRAERAKIRQDVDASVPLRNADIMIDLHYAMHPPAAPDHRTLIDPNIAAGPVGHAVHEPRVHTDSRAHTTAFGHVMLDPT